MPKAFSVNAVLEIYKKSKPVDEPVPVDEDGEDDAHADMVRAMLGLRALVDTMVQSLVLLFRAVGDDVVREALQLSPSILSIDGKLAVEMVVW